MAVCDMCGREMLEASTCTERTVELVDGRYERIRFGAEGLRIDSDTCDDCGVVRGGLDQQISCDCFETWDDD
jgi:hypothetical protein